MISGFGERLRAARKEASYSVLGIVDDINALLREHGLKEIHTATYYAWERISTVREDKKGRSFPHPGIFPLILDKFGITGYWLFYGDQGGRIARYTSELPNQLVAELAKQQLSPLSANAPLDDEINRLKSKLTEPQRAALLAFLKTLD